MPFKPGDRVLMVKHADWKGDATGTVTSPARRPITLADGTSDPYYWVAFDEPQRDSTNELNGVDRTYDSATILARFLQRLD
jgi:hypothetical protein